MYLLIAVIGYAILAVVGVLDKFILDKSVRSPAIFVFYSTIFVLPVALLIPFGAAMPAGADWWWAFAAGGFFTLGLWAMFIGYQKSEVSHVGPLVGAVIPIFVIILGALLLNEVFSPVECAGMALLILGSLLISFEKSAAHNGWHHGMLWGILAGLLFAVSHVASKILYIDYGFFGGFVWSRALMALSGALFLLLPSVRRGLFGKHLPSAKIGKQVFLVGVNKGLAVAGVLLVQWTIALGSVSIVNALGGLQYGLLVVLVALLSKFYPKIFREQYSRGEIIQEVAAVILIIVGLGLLI